MAGSSTSFNFQHNAAFLNQRFFANSKPPRPSHDEEEYSRKVFIGGLPSDITEEGLAHAFSKFGPMQIQWPIKRDCYRKMANGMLSGPGYVFIVYAHARSVLHLLRACHPSGDRFFIAVSSQMFVQKPVQVRAWRHSDVEFKRCPDDTVNPRWMVFIGGLPRPTKAIDLYNALSPHLGDIVYVNIDVDAEYRYPKGAARIVFARYPIFVAAMSCRFVNIPDGDGGEKRVEIKPYTMSDQPCDECEGKLCGGQCAAYYCASPLCLQYYCEVCWNRMHFGPNVVACSQRNLHTPFVRMGDTLKSIHQGGQQGIQQKSEEKPAAV